MSVGILTFHRVNNIGAMLQAYALQTYLEKQGVQVQFVDLPMPVNRPHNDYFVANMKNADFFVKKFEVHRLHRRKMFDDFRANYLHISSPFLTGEETVGIYDRLIVGSDQVWNYSIPDTDDRYFLPFAKNVKRYAYSASFGGDEVPGDKKQFVAEELKKFERISVRENSGRDIVQALTGQICDVTLDPTFLLSREEWNQLTHPVEEKYVFVYMVQPSDILIEKAKEYATSQKIGVKVICNCFNFKFGFDAWSGYDIGDFVSYVRYAEKVYTNSFHGTALSLIYDKDVETECLKSSLKSRMSRITELLEKRDVIDEEIVYSKRYLTEILQGEPI